MQKKEKIDINRFRVAIFGSARIKKGDTRYKLVFTLAKMIAESGMDVVTGGGPGLMDAASRGHHVGRKKKFLQSVGLTIKLPTEQKDSYHLDIKKEFHKFSNRLDTFMKLSNAVVVAPGGIGTMLEFLYTWQVLQVGKDCDTFIILLGEHWHGLMKWIHKDIYHKRLMSKEDFNNIFIAKNCTEAVALLNQAHEDVCAGRHPCKNFETYKKLGKQAH